MKNKKISLIKTFILEHRIAVMLVTIVAFGFILRFYNYENRWGLAYDQARDVIVSRHAIETGQIPLIGPFSSAGQFVYGPQWYWLIIIFSLPYFPSIMTPWIVLNILYSLLVVVYYFIGKKVMNTTVGLLAALYAAVSPALISLSINLISPSMVGVTSALTSLIFLYYISNQRVIYAFLLGFLVANSINIHFQALGLVFLIPLAILVVTISRFRKQRKKVSVRNVLSFFILNVVWASVGFFIPFIPLFIFELKTNFYETRGFLDYYFYGQYKIYVPNRWLTYMFDFWPSAWARVIGGYSIISFGLMSLVVVSMLWWIYKRERVWSYFCISVGFVIMFFLFRYFRGERYDNYIAFFHVYILIFSATATYFIYKFNRFIALIFVCIIVFGNLSVSIPELILARNTTSEEAKQWVYELIQKYPDRKFSLYDHAFEFPNRGYVIGLYLMEKNKLSDDGMKIGTAYFYKKKAALRNYYPRIIQRENALELYNLNSSNSAQLERVKWFFINPSQIYYSVEKWYEDI